MSFQTGGLKVEVPPIKPISKVSIKSEVTVKLDIESPIYSETDTYKSLDSLFTDSEHNNLESYDTEQFPKDCPNYKYLPSILPKKDRIVVLGDIHGDYGLTTECLELANVAKFDEKGNLKEWIGGTTVVVQIGDQIDRCRPKDFRCDNPNATYNDEHSDIRILELFTKLHELASKDGGAVYSLLGNHELMNVQGNMNYVSYKGLTGFIKNKDNEKNKEDVKAGRKARIKAFAPGNEYGKFLGCTRLSAIIIGSFLFVHAGIIPEFAKKINLQKPTDIYKLNIGVRKWLLKLIDKDYVADIVTSKKYSMFWDRILGAIPHYMSNKDKRCVNYLEPVLKILNVGKMVIGHTPQFYSNKDGINPACDEKLWRVDIGSSAAFNFFDDKFKKENVSDEKRQPQILEIRNDKEITVLRFKKE